MTVVREDKFYDFIIENNTAECEVCGKEMKILDVDDSNRNMREPYWFEEKVHVHIGGKYNKFHAYCYSCYKETYF